MMKRRIFLCLPLLFHHFSTFSLSEKFLTSAEKEATTIHGLPIIPYPLKVSGYVKHESFWDTRQVVGAGDDQFLLYPEKKKFDPLCRDINAKGQFDMVPFQTRLRVEMEGPDIKKAKSLGIIEADFFGRGFTLSNLSTGEALNIFRMRHAFAQLTWENGCTLLTGQTWHPLYVVGADPRTISFNTGDPMDTFCRNPQVRVIYEPTSNISLIFAASSQLDCKSDGPIGLSTTYLRNAVVPILDAQIHAKWGENNKYWIGAGIDFMRIIPRLETDTCYKADESLNSVSAILFQTADWENFSIRNKILYIQNGSYLNYLGGYAVHSIADVTDQRTYTNIAATGFWTDWDITKSKSIIPGIFFGFVKNLGAQDTIIPNTLDDCCNITRRTVYGLGTDIDYVLRVSPRVRWLIRNFEFSGELEYTRAAYGTLDCKAHIIDTCPVGDVRILFALFYYF